MAKEPLLDAQINAGMKLLKKLDGDNYDIQSALWFYNPDIEKWKLLLFSPKFEAKDAITQYSKLFKELSDANTAGALAYESLQLVFEEDDLLDLLKGAIRVEGESVVRMSSTSINGYYVDDSIIYRNSIH